MNNAEKTKWYEQRITVACRLMRNDIADWLGEALTLHLNTVQDWSRPNVNAEIQHLREFINTAIDKIDEPDPTHFRYQIVVQAAQHLGYGKPNPRQPLVVQYRRLLWRIK